MRPFVRDKRFRTECEIPGEAIRTGKVKVFAVLFKSSCDFTLKL